MLILLKDANINFVYNSDFVFQDLRIKENLIILDSLEDTLNIESNKTNIAKNFCGAQLIDGKLSYMSLSELTNSNNNYYFNLVDAYNNLFKTSLSNVFYGDLVVSYNQKFNVSGESSIENIRNIVYNTIVSSIIEDYKTILKA